MGVEQPNADRPGLGQTPWRQGLGGGVGANPSPAKQSGVTLEALRAVFLKCRTGLIYKSFASLLAVPIVCCLASLDTLPVVEF